MTSASTFLGSTKGMSCENGLAYWQTVIEDIHVPADMIAPEERPYSGYIKSLDASGMRLSLFRTSSAKISRKRSHIAKKSDADFILLIPLAGKFTVSQFGREEQYSAGAACLVDSGEPFDFIQLEDIDCASLKVSRTFMETFLLFPQDFCAQKINISDGLSNTFAETLISVSRQISPDSRDSIASALLSITPLLITSIFNHEDGYSFAGNPPTNTKSILNRALTIIDNMAHIEGTNPSDIANELGISVSYLHELFAQTGNTVGGLILKRRLENARLTLVNPANQNLLVSEIAYRCGFKNLSHFSRAFKVTFGINPRALRDTIKVSKHPVNSSKSRG